MGPRSEPAPDSVRFMVPDQIPALILERYLSFNSGLACAEIASAAPELRKGSKANAISAEFHISQAAVP